MKKEKNKTTPSANNYDGFPDDSFDLINKYGTYEIQPTCHMQTDFPQISQATEPFKQKITKKKEK